MAEPWFASNLDSMTPVGTPNINNAAVSLAITSERGIETSAVTNGAISPVLPERVDGVAGFAVRKTNPTNARVLVELRGASSANRIRLIQPVIGANDDYGFQYWDGSAWVNIGATFNLSSDVNHCRVEWSGYGTSSGSISIRVFKDGGEAVVATRSVSGLDFTALGGIVQIFVGSSAGGSSTIYSAIFVADDLGDTSYVYTDVANANGSDAGGSGTFSSVNSVGTTYDSTFISLNTAGLRRSVKTSGARSYDGRTIRALAVNARLRRGATGPTRARIYLTIGGTRYYHPNTQLLTTTFTSYIFVFETDPSTSLAWELTNAEAASLEWGVEAVA